MEKPEKPLLEDYFGQVELIGIGSAINSARCRLKLAENASEREKQFYDDTYKLYSEFIEKVLAAQKALLDYYVQTLPPDFVGWDGPDPQ